MLLAPSNYKNKPLSYEAADSRKDFERRKPARRVMTMLRPLASERPFGTINCSLSLPFAPNQKVVTRAAQGTRCEKSTASTREGNLLATR